MSSKQLPEDIPLTEVLRKIQDVNVSLDQANLLFTEYILPIVDKVKQRLMARHRQSLVMAKWFSENAESVSWEVVVQEPRTHKKLSFDPSRSTATFQAWLMKCLRNRAITELRKEGKLPLRRRADDSEDFNLAESVIARPAYQPQEHRLAEVRDILTNALAKLAKVSCFHPFERSNGVDYFVILLVLIRVRLAQELYQAYRENHWDQDLGVQVVRCLNEIWPTSIDDWRSRRATSWTPTLGEILDWLDDHWKRSNERPRKKHVVSYLSHFLTNLRKDCSEPEMRVRWATWTARTRCVYSKNRALLCDLERAVLDWAILREEETEEQTAGSST